jgi:hypothetical protein
MFLFEISIRITKFRSVDFLYLHYYALERGLPVLNSQQGLCHMKLALNFSLFSSVSFITLR